MTPPPFDAIVSWLGGRLFVASIEALILVSLVWFACRRGNLSAAMQATLWWLAALKIVIVLLPLPAVTLPVLRATSPLRITPADVVADRAMAATPVIPALRGARDTNAVSWNAVAVVLWLVVVAVHAAQLIGQHGRLRRLVRRSTPSDDEVAPLAAAIGLRRIPAVHRSSEVDTPQIVGMIRPAILLPATPMAEADLVMALSHELMHIRRGDLALGWIPAIAERLFFFHPLVRLAAREYQTTREAACDAAVVRALGVSAGDYARLLVRFGVTPGQPAFVAGGASRSLSSLRRRLAMLQQSSASGSPRIGWALSAVIVLAMIPIQLVAQAPSHGGVRLQPGVQPVTVGAADLARSPVNGPATSPYRARVLADITAADAREEPATADVRQEPADADDREPKMPTGQFLEQQLLEAHKALRREQGDNLEALIEIERRLELAKQASDTAAASREIQRQTEIEAVRRGIETRGEADSQLRAEGERAADQAARDANQRARAVERAVREVEQQKLRDTDFKVRTRAEYEKALEAARQRENGVSQREFTEQQLDGLRRTIEQLASQLDEMRKMERQLREQLRK